MGLLREIARFPNRGRGNFSKLPRERRERECVLVSIVPAKFCIPKVRHAASFLSGGERDKGTRRKTKHA
jgi:hypothetical protein